MEEPENPLLRIMFNGDLVAEANLVVYDGLAAWTAFVEAFANISPSIVGELFNTVRVACHPETRELMGPQGITIALYGKRQEEREAVAWPS